MCLLEPTRPVLALATDDRGESEADLLPGLTQGIIQAGSRGQRNSGGRVPLVWLALLEGYRLGIDLPAREFCRLARADAWLWAAMPAGYRAAGPRRACTESAC